MFLTFILAVFGWIIFRAESIGQAWEYFQGMLQFGTLRASYRFFSEYYVVDKTMFVLIMLIVEWMQRGQSHGLVLGNNPRYIRVLVYWALAILIYINCPISGSMNFVYFQF